MILQRIRFIVGDAGFEPWTSAPEVWCATSEPPHIQTKSTFSRTCSHGSEGVAWVEVGVVVLLLWLLFPPISCCCSPPGCQLTASHSSVPVGQHHRRRINTEEKAKVVAAAWVKELIKFLAALAILNLDDLENRMNCTRIILREGRIHPILQIVRVKNSQRGKELNQFCPPNSSNSLCLLFCINPSSMDYK